MGSHQALEDIALMRVLLICILLFPAMVLRQLMQLLPSKTPGPFIFVRSFKSSTIENKGEFKFGKAQVLSEEMM